MSDGATDLLLEIGQVKFRNNNAGKSPIGSLRIFGEHIEWKDDASNEVTKFQFVQIKGQRVSPPNKNKVQLQVCLHNDEQATFVFMNSSLDKEKLIKERDLAKETLQQALIAHRSRVAQLAAKNETCSKTAELEAKQKLLLNNKRLEQLYKHLVSTKLISPQDFWTDYYKSNGVSEDEVGVSGGFLANIAQCEGANGVKLNLNTEIIQAIFNTYPVVEKKHLELVPHEMTEQEFWSKFFQSHYFHREREVLPNPNDPFHDCVKQDESEIDKLVQDGVKRKRFDFEYLSDNSMADLNKKPEGSKTVGKTMLVRRCNYLSERILTSLKSVLMEQGDKMSNETDSNGKGNGVTNGINRGSGFGALRRVEEVESRLESSELGVDGEGHETQPVKVVGEEQIAVGHYPEDEARQYHSLVLNFLNSNTDEDIIRNTAWVDELDDDNDDQIDISMNGTSSLNPQYNDPSSGAPLDWGLSPSDLTEVKNIHESVAELLKHFWTCFPTTTPELEKKIEMMIETLNKYQGDQMAHASHKYGVQNFEHCFAMIERAEKRYQQYLARKRK